MHSNVIAAGFGLLSSLTIAWGTVVRHRVAGRVEVKKEKSSGAAARAMAGQPIWWAGTFLALSGYALQVVALGFGTLLVVQPMLVLSLVFTLPMSAWAEGRKISRAETTWALLLSLAVAAVVLLGRPNPGTIHPPLSRWIPALGIGIVVLFALDRWAHTQFRRRKAIILGTVTGGIYGYVALLSKAVTDNLVHDGVVQMMLSWEFWALIAGAVIGTIVQQSSFNAGALKHSLPAMTIVEPMLAFGLGYVVLDESFAVTGAGWILMIAAIAGMVVSAVKLSMLGAAQSG
ncbi:DMT family transporter [Corynebacterium mendelii]|uniref:DMT family transporter n=1 Tax=Corynebacterium mendelii TaxID=2765362 RepID=A0A939E0S6_9CORY|nr:DMT family transporter [Corynebacterium mendelii]MBN9643743.1 DMT family transporter [Corynebacterium mendelii]